MGHQGPAANWAGLLRTQGQVDAGPHSGVSSWTGPGRPPSPDFVLQLLGPPLQRPQAKEGSLRPRPRENKRRGGVHKSQGQRREPDGAKQSGDASPPAQPDDFQLRAALGLIGAFGQEVGPQRGSVHWGALGGGRPFCLPVERVVALGGAFGRSPAAVQLGGHGTWAAERVGQVSFWKEGKEVVSHLSPAPGSSHSEEVPQLQLFGPLDQETQGFSHLAGEKEEQLLPPAEFQLLQSCTELQLNSSRLGNSFYPEFTPCDILSLCPTDYAQRGRPLPRPTGGGLPFSAAPHRAPDVALWNGRKLSASGAAPFGRRETGKWTLHLGSVLQVVGGRNQEAGSASCSTTLIRKFSLSTRKP